MEHYQRVSISAPPHSEACPTLVYIEELMLALGACHDRDVNPGSLCYKPSALPLIYPAIPLLLCGQSLTYNIFRLSSFKCVMNGHLWSNWTQATGLLSWLLEAWNETLVPSFSAFTTCLSIYVIYTFAPTWAHEEECNFSLVDVRTRRCTNQGY